MVRTKSQAQKGKNILPDDIDSFEKFVSAEAAARYKAETVHRELHEEKGFILTHKQHYGLTEEMVAPILCHKWKTFATHPPTVMTPWVREFYANLGGTNQTHAMVRGCQIRFSAASINFQYKLEELEDEYLPLLETVTEQQLSQMKQELTVTGTQWLDPTSSQKTLRRPSLQVVAKVWYHFLRNSLLPTMHNETVSKERLVLLYCILKSKKIDVGKLIEREINACANLKKGRLVFPGLITALCKKAGVDVLPGEHEEPNGGGINSALINQFQQNTASMVKKRAKEGRSTKGEPSEQPDRSEEATSQIEVLAQLMEQHMQHQRLFWKFSYDHFLWQQKIMESNNLSLSIPPPSFPDQLLPKTVPSHTGKSNTPGKSNSTRKTTPSGHSVQEDSDHLDWMPPPPSSKLKTPTTSKHTGKEPLKPSSLKQDHETAADEEEDSEAQFPPEDSPAPSKSAKRKATTHSPSAVIKGILTAYPDSEEDEEVSPPQAKKMRTSLQQLGSPAASEEEEAATDEEAEEDNQDSDEDAMTVVKAVGGSSKKRTKTAGSRKSSRIKKTI